MRVTPTGLRWSCSCWGDPPTTPVAVVVLLGWLRVMGRLAGKRSSRVGTSVTQWAAVWGWPLAPDRLGGQGWLGVLRGLAGHREAAGWGEGVAIGGSVTGQGLGWGRLGVLGRGAGGRQRWRGIGVAGGGQG